MCELSFYEYLKQMWARHGAIVEHRLVAHYHDDGSITFYIHPLNKDGITPDYQVIGNQLVQINKG
jgi:hypothetical protein